MPCTTSSFVSNLQVYNLFRIPTKKQKNQFRKIDMPEIQFNMLHHLEPLESMEGAKFVAEINLQRLKSSRLALKMLQFLKGSLTKSAQRHMEMFGGDIDYIKNREETWTTDCLKSEHVLQCLSQENHCCSSLIKYGTLESSRKSVLFSLKILRLTPQD